MRKRRKRGPYKKREILNSIPDAVDAVEKKLGIDANLDGLAKEMVSIIEETRKATKDVFLGIRLELIKSRNEIFLMKRGIRPE